MVRCPFFSHTRSCRPEAEYLMHLHFSTEGTDSYCVSMTYLFSGGLFGWLCGPEPTELTAYATYTNDEPSFSSAAPTVYIYTNTGSATPSSTSSIPTSSSSSSPVNFPVSTPPAPIVASHGLSTGAKAGIAVGAIGAVAIIAALIAVLFFQKRRNDKNRQQAPPSNFTPNQPQMAQQQQQPPPIAPMPASAPLSPPLSQQHHMSIASNPSATSSTPLTQANMRAMSASPPPASDVLPSESASQIQSPTAGGSVLSGPVSPTGYSNTGSQEHSGLGSLPQYPTGASAFPHGAQGGGAGQSVLSNPNTFISAPGVHAPSPYEQR